MGTANVLISEDCCYIVQNMEKEVESLGKEIVKDASSLDDNAAAAGVDKVPAKIDGKELVQLFKSMSVSKKSKLVRGDPKNWRSSKGSFSSLTKKSQAIDRLEKSLQKNLKHRSSFVRQNKKKPDVRLVRVNLRPSKLSSVVAQLQNDYKNKSPDSRFSEFSADCSKALETIEKTTIIKPQSSTTNKIKKKIKKFPVKPKLNSGSDNDDNVDKDVVLGHEEGPNSSKKPSRVQKKRKASTSCAQQARNECYNTNSAEINLSIDYLADYLEETILFPKKMSYMAELMYT